MYVKRRIDGTQCARLRLTTLNPEEPISYYEGHDHETDR